VQQTTTALMGYGAGLLGLVAIKVLAPGFYASQNIKTPVKIAVVVLVITQLLNLALVPYLQHAGLALAIGIGALINAASLLVGLIRRGSYTPAPGWAVFSLQVVAASALLAVFLLWAADAVNWIGLKQQYFQRIGLLALVLIASAAIYFVVLWMSGLKLRQLLRR
jgi:putative peptidoglycan lipid II flippase